MKDKLFTIIGVIISLAIGYKLNQIANERNNAKLIAAFKAELEAYNQQKSRATPMEKIAIEQKQQIIQAQINLLEQL